MIRLIRIELFKILHQRSLIFIVLGLVAFAVLLQIGFRFQGHNPLTHIARRAKIDVDLVLNAINSTRLIMNACYILLFPTLSVMVFAGQIAGERSSGTLRVVLSRPVSRKKLYFVKFLVSVLVVTCIVGLFVGAALLSGLFFFGSHEFISAARVFDLINGGASEILSFSEGLRRLGISVLLISCMLLPVASLSFYFSVFCRSSLSAMVSALLICIACIVIQGLADTGVLSFFITIRPYLFTTAMECWQYVFTPQISWDQILPRMAMGFIYTLTFFCAGLVHFHFLDLSE